MINQNIYKKLLEQNSVLCLMAPTASGKTALAFELYDTGFFELISVDSALVYRDMNIGTAKPTKEELLHYPHHLVDIISPTETYSVANFVQDVKRLIDDIHQRGKLPLLVGGTMMYFMALFDGLSAIPDTKPDIRAEVEQWRQQQGIEAIYNYLKQIDNPLAQRLKANDSQRITRAVEIFLQTNKTMTDWQRLPKNALANNSNQQWYGLAVIPDRTWLHQRIEQRLEIMWQQGFLNEVIHLIEKYPLKKTMPSMRCVGYRQVWEFLQINIPSLFVEHKDSVKDNLCYQDTVMIKNLRNINTVTQDKACQEMKNKALYATRQLAKRQYTWLRKLINLKNTQLKQTMNQPNYVKKCITEIIPEVNHCQPKIISFVNIKEVKQYLI